MEPSPFLLFELVNSHLRYSARSKQVKNALVALERNMLLPLIGQCMKSSNLAEPGILCGDFPTPHLTVRRHLVLRVIETCLMSELSDLALIRSSGLYTGDTDGQARQAERTGEAPAAGGAPIAQGHSASRGRATSGGREVDGERVGQAHRRGRSGRFAQRWSSRPAGRFGCEAASRAGASVERRRDGARVPHGVVDSAAGWAADRGPVRSAIQRGTRVAYLARSWLHCPATHQAGLGA